MEVISYKEKQDLKGQCTDREQDPRIDEKQTLSIGEEGVGKKQWGGIQWDSQAYSYQPNFPEDSKARTSFYAKDAKEAEELYERYWKLHHGRAHTYEGWNGQRSRQEDRDDFYRATVILSQLEVKEWVRDAARERVMEEGLNGFNRYYNGFDGACVGFALLYQYDTVEESKESYVFERADLIIDADREKLVEYVWRKYRGDVQ